jgi:ketosteroid isomerase-like protein
MRTLGVAVALVWALVAASPAAAQTSNPRPTRVELDSASKAELLLARERIWRAWFANDSAELARLLPPAAVAAEGVDGWEDRAAIVAGSRGFAASGGKLVRIAFFDTEIVTFGTTAIVHARFELELENGGQRNKRTGRATEIFVRRDNRWVNPMWVLE